MEDPLAQLLLDAWKELIRNFYSKASAAPEDILLDRLQESDPLEGNYLYFKSFVQSLPLSRDLELEDTFRSRRRGGRYFGAKISRPSWHPGEYEETTNGFQLDAKRHFNIHFEPQFHYLKEVMELYVHYEVNPYETAAWVNSHIPPSQLEAYNAVRDEFVNRLRLKEIGNLSIGGRTNQVAKAALTLDGATVSVAREAIGDIINRVAVHIGELRDDSHGVFSN